jgi:hypothetical protein
LDESREITIRQPAAQCLSTTPIEGVFWPLLTAPAASSRNEAAFSQTCRRDFCGAAMLCSWPAKSQAGDGYEVFVSNE